MSSKKSKTIDSDNTLVNLNALANGTPEADEAYAIGDAETTKAEPKNRNNPPRYWIVRYRDGSVFPTPICIMKSYRAAERRAAELSATLAEMPVTVTILKVKVAEPPKGYVSGIIKRKRKA